MLMIKHKYPKANILLYIILLAFSTIVYGKNYYVATSGDDVSHDGLSVSTPFKTVQKAADIASPSDFIYVREGTYREMVDIKSDGLTFQPYNNEKVIINGTELMLNWTTVSGNTYSCEMNWELSQNWGSNQVFCNGKMIELCRWPNQLSSDMVMPTNAVAESASASGTFLTITDNEFMEPDGRWVGAKIWINLSRNGYDGQGWTGIVTATSQANHTITVNFGSNPRLGDEPWGIGKNTEYFLFDPTIDGINATGGVDAVLSNGEWWKNNSTLFVKTPMGLKPFDGITGSEKIESKKRHFAFWASSPKAAYKIKGFNLFSCSITTDNNPWVNRNQILEAAHDIVIEDLKIDYISHQTDMTQNWQDQHYYGAGLVLRGRNNMVRNCTIQYSATAALHISGFGNRAMNNVIAHTNYMCSNAGAISTGFICLDAEIAYNEIYNTTLMAINFRYAKNSNINVPDVFRIHHNTIYNFLRRSGDSGAIDNFGSNLQGARIDHNIIYNTGVVISHMIHGIYLDFADENNLSYCTLDHNIIYDVPQPILASSTRFVNIYNNTLFSNNNQPCISNSNGNTKGADMKIYNNIMNKEPNIIGQYGYDVSLSDIRNNIFNASGAFLNEIFEDTAKHNYQLKVTAAMAIDQGIDVGNYNVNVQGLPDLGAFEKGVIADDEAPSNPYGLTYQMITTTDYWIYWNPSVDNTGGIVNYLIFKNGMITDTIQKEKFRISGLLPDTKYQIMVKAIDNAGNNSASGDSIQFTTLPATTLHLEAEHNNFAGGCYVTNIDAINKACAGFSSGVYIRYDSLVFNGQDVFKASFAKPSASGEKLEIRLDSLNGSLAGTFTITSTVSWSSYQIQQTSLIKAVYGTHTVFIVAVNAPNGACNLDWIELSKSTATVYHSEKQISNIVVYPNPVGDDIYIDGMNLNGYSYYILNQLGNIVLESQLSNNTIDVSSLVNGFYILLIGEMRIKIVKG